MKLENLYRIILIFIHLFSVDLLMASNNIHQVSIGEDHTCILDEAGVKCMGYDWDINTTRYWKASKEVKVPQNLKFPTHVVSGDYFTCSLDFEGVSCWGKWDSYREKEILDSVKNASQITAGKNQVCALENGSVKCWGENYTYSLRKNSIRMIEGLKNPTKIYNGYNRICALDDEGVKCWRNNGKDQVEVFNFSKKPTQVTSGYEFICMLDDNKVKCTEISELGAKYGQTLVPGTLEKVKDISAGRRHVCAIDNEGVKCWGDNSHRQREVPRNLKNPRQISAGYDRTCVIDDDGLKCWGKNIVSDDSVPNDLENISKVFTAGDITCAQESNRLKCWDYSGIKIVNSSNRDLFYDHSYKFKGQLNRNVLIDMNLSDIKEIAVGDRHLCLLNNEGVRCWGDDEYKRAERSRLTGTNITELFENPTHIIANGGQTCAVDERDSKTILRCWGHYQFGLTFKHGRGALRPYIKKIHIENNDTCIVAGVKIMCWGELGEFSKIPGYSVSSLFNKPIAKVTRNEICFREDKSLKCWNYKEYKFNIVNESSISSNQKCSIYGSEADCEGELQDTVPHDLKNPSQVSTSDNHACLLDDEGLKCWGGVYSVVNSIYLSGNRINDHLDFSLEPIKRIAERSIHYSSKVRALLYERIIESKILNPIIKADMGDEHRSKKVSDALLVIELLRPTLISTDSDFYLNRVTPYVNSLENYLKGLNQSNNQLVKNNTVILELIRVTSETCEELIPFNESKKLIPFKKALAMAIVSGSSVDINETLNEYRNIKLVLSNLNGSEKTRFLFETLDVAMKMIGRKGK